MTYEVDTNLIRTNIRRADNTRLKRMRFDKSEPIYSVLRRVLDTADTEKSDMAYMMEEYRNASANWKKKYEELLKQVESYKKKVHHTMEEFVKIE